MCKKSLVRVFASTGLLLYMCCSRLFFLLWKYSYLLSALRSLRDELKWNFVLVCSSNYLLFSFIFYYYLTESPAAGGLMVFTSNSSMLFLLFARKWSSFYKENRITLFSFDDNISVYFEIYKHAIHRSRYWEELLLQCEKSIQGIAAIA